MRIVFLDAKTVGHLPEEIDQLQKFGEVDIHQTTSPSETVPRIADATIIITNKVILNRQILSQSKSVKLICIAATGMNNVDLEYCKEAGIIVKNAIGYSSKSVAQFTFNCLLHFIHKTNYYDHYVKSGQYSKNDIFTHIHHDFFEIGGKTFGIIGLGNIGTEVAALAKAFGANVCYYSTSGKNNNTNYRQVSLEKLLLEADFISIHCPLNEKTKNLIGANELEKMKKNAIIINMGRGGIVNEQALANSLNRNIIGGAITDVLTKEPIEADNPLIHLDNPEKMLITPHIAWASIEARKKLLHIVFQHIEEFKKSINYQ